MKIENVEELKDLLDTLEENTDVYISDENGNPVTLYYRLEECGLVFE